MARWEHSRILPWFCDKFGTGEENCLPYLPEEWKCRIDGKNEEIDILHAVNSEYGKAGTLNLLKRPGLKTWTIECFFAHPDKPEFATVEESDGWTPQFWVDFFESAMYEQKVLEMTVEGLDFICYVSVENFEHSKRAGEELDTYYTITLKEYQFVKIEKEDVKIDVVIPPPPKNVDIPGGKVVKNSNKYLIGRAWEHIATYSEYGESIGPACLLNPYSIGDKKALFNSLPVKVIEEKPNVISNVTLTTIGSQIWTFWNMKMNHWQAEHGHIREISFLAAKSELANTLLDEEVNLKESVKDDYDLIIKNFDVFWKNFYGNAKEIDYFFVDFKYASKIFIFALCNKEVYTIIENTKHTTTNYDPVNNSWRKGISEVLGRIIRAKEDMYSGVYKNKYMELKDIDKISQIEPLIDFTLEYNGVKKEYTKDSAIMYCYSKDLYDEKKTEFVITYE